MKPLKLRNQSSLNDFLDTLQLDREVGLDGHIKLQGFEWDEAANILATFFDHDSTDDLENLERLIFRAFLSKRLPSPFELSDLVAECEEIRRSDAKAPRSKFNVLSAVTSLNGIDFEDFEFGNISVSFKVSASMAKEHDRVVNHHFPRREHPSLHSRMLPYVATVFSTDVESAFRSARDSIDVWRGSINLARNISKYSRMSSSGARLPLNDFVNAQFSTVFDADGKINEDSVYYFADWSGPRSRHLDAIKSAHLLTRIKRYISYTDEKHSLSAFAKDLLIKYVRACDTPNWQYAFLELWGILEQACCLQPGQDHRKVVDRVCCLYADKKQTQLYLNHLRLRRNNIVHKGYEQRNATSERMLFQLNRYVSQVLYLLLSNKLGLNGKREWESFLDLGEPLESLKSRRQLIGRMIEFRGGEETDSA